MNTRIQRLEESIKSLRKQINEVLASPYPFKLNRPEESFSGYEVVAEFASAAANYFYNMEIYPVEVEDDEPAIVAEISFVDEQGSFNVTGKGDAFRVMATVLEITKKILNDDLTVATIIDDILPGTDREPYIDVITFTSITSEHSRMKLYKRIAQSTPGFTYMGGREGSFYIVNNKIEPERKQAIITSVV